MIKIMGITSSRHDDVYEDIDNDYELVIRVSKALERELTQTFGIRGDDDGLSAKITQLESRYPSLSSKSIHSMRRLVMWRNKLVHDFDVDSLSDLNVSRYGFCSQYSDVKEELEGLMARQREGSGRLTTRVLSTGDTEEFGAGTALLVGGALVASLMMAACSTEHSCRRCGCRVSGDRKYCSSCSLFG